MVWGIDKIDRQHQKLVGFLNELYDAMKKGKGNEALKKVFGGLVLYTKTHFADEEKLLADNGYPDYAAHKAKHEKMTAKVMEMHKDFLAGKISSPVQITNFLKDWLAKHIMETDRKYGPYLNGKGIH